VTPTPAHGDSLSRLPGSQVGASKPEPHPEVQRIRESLVTFVPDGFRDEDGTWWDGPHRRDALLALDVLVGRLEQAEQVADRALAAAEQKDEALRQYADASNWGVTRRFDGSQRVEFLTFNEAPWTIAREALGVPPP
jgi:hypothetical protein